MIYLTKVKSKDPELDALMKELQQDIIKTKRRTPRMTAKKRKIYRARIAQAVEDRQKYLDAANAHVDPVWLELFPVGAKFKYRWAPYNAEKVGVVTGPPLVDDYGIYIPLGKCKKSSTFNVGAFNPQWLIPV